MSEKKYILQQLAFFSKENNLDGQIAQAILDLVKQKKLYLKNVALIAKCSMSAIIKFMQNKLKIPSFYQLKYALQTTSESNSNINYQDHAFKKIVDTLEKMHTIYNKNKIAQIVALLKQFNNIWIVAKSDTFALAFDFAFKLKRLKLLSQTIEAGGEMDIKQNLPRSGDGIIIISNSGETKELVKFFLLNQQKQITTLVFTSKASSTLAKLAKEKCFLIEHYENTIQNVEILLTPKLYFTYVFDLICFGLVDNFSNCNN